LKDEFASLSLDSGVGLLVVSARCIVGPARCRQRFEIVPQRPGNNATSANNFLSKSRSRCPRATLQALLRENQVRGALQSTSNSERQNPEKFFSASEIHLSANSEADFVMLGAPPFSGADNDWFWIVSRASKKQRVILFAGGNELRVMDRETNRYKDIQCIWSSPMKPESRRTDSSEIATDKRM
jgi:hypothetical protein